MPRVAVRNIPASLKYNGVDTYIIATTTPVGWETAFTFSVYFKTRISTSRQQIMNFGAGGSSRMGITINSTSNGQNTVASGYYNGAVLVAAKALYNPGEWNHLVYTWNGVSAVLYINGSSANNVSSTFISSAVTGLSLGTQSGAFNNGYMTDAKVWTRVLTVAEINTLYESGTYSTESMYCDLRHTDGAGTTVTDFSGNGNHATLFNSPTWSSDTPSKARKEVNGNLVTNGDFEYAPPTNVPLNGNIKFIDGTSVGSATNSLFGWHAFSGGSSEVMFDTTVKHSGTASLKISTVGVGQYREVSWNAPNAPSSTISDRYYGKSFISVLPGTSYTCKYWMKTNYISGDSNNGAYLNIIESTGTGVSAQSTEFPYIKTTTDWTQYTAIFTTSSATRFINLQTRLYGHNGVGTLIMDAWFDDIDLRPTTAIARQLITGPYRQPINNLVRNGDFEYAPPFTDATNTSQRFIDGTASGSTTNDLFRWFYATGNTGFAQFDPLVKYSGNYSLRLDSTVASGGILGTAVTLTTPVSPPIANQKAYMIPVQPSTLYTMTCRVRTDSISNLNSKGVRVRALRYTGASTSSAGYTDSSYITGTNDWQLITLTFTTEATACFVQILLNIFNETGTAWFDNITLHKTTPTTRLIA